MYGEFEYFRWSKKINLRYRERHGYHYAVSHETPRNDRHVTWHKVPVMKKELRDYDYILFLDMGASWVCRNEQVRKFYQERLMKQDV